jgi:glutathione S-transferase
MTDVIKFYYFDAPGRGEQVRCLLKHAKVPFEDIRYTYEKWAAEKTSPKFEYSQMPMLEYNGKYLSQTPAIMHFLAMKYKYVPENPDLAYQVMNVYCAAVDVFDVFAKWNYVIKDPKEKEASKADYFNKYIPFMFGKFEERLKVQTNKNVIVGDKLSYADFGFAGFCKQTFMAPSDAALYEPSYKKCPLLKAYFTELMKL